MAPMIGSMFGPWGAAIGGAVSGIGLLINAGNKTDEELLKEAQEANEELSEIKTNLENNEKTLDTLESQEALFNTLIKGVNQTTGENMSLNDSEWQQYQEILSTVIGSHNELYAAYDEEGNIIAKNKDGIADLNNAMNQSIKIMKDKVR
jgi:peptidoglycan hydrolase CwlO-like protein